MSETRELRPPAVMVGRLSVVVGDITFDAWTDRSKRPGPAFTRRASHEMPTFSAARLRRQGGFLAALAPVFGRMATNAASVPG